MKKSEKERERVCVGGGGGGGEVRKRERGNEFHLPNILRLNGIIPTYYLMYQHK